MTVIDSRTLLELETGRAGKTGGGGLNLGSLDAARIGAGYAPSVVVVEGFMRGNPAIADKVDYLGKDGESLENQDGVVFENSEKARPDVWKWEDAFDNRKGGRDAMHLVVSTPGPNSPEAVERAARAFGHSAFPRHRYVFSIHVPREATETRDSVENTHAHFIVESVSSRGKGPKLDNSFKNQRDWRELWARAARREGINLEASTAQARGVFPRGNNSRIAYLRKKGITPRIDEVRKADAEIAVHEKRTGLTEGEKRFRARVERQAVQRVRAGERHGKVAMAIEEVAKQSSGEAKALLTKKARQRAKLSAAQYDYVQRLPIPQSPRMREIEAARKRLEKHLDL